LVIVHNVSNNMKVAAIHTKVITWLKPAGTNHNRVIERPSGMAPKSI
jgi:hypothetical protein